MLKLKYYAPAFGWGIFIFILSTMPGKDFPQVPDILDLLSVDKLVASRHDGRTKVICRHENHRRQAP